MKTLKSLSAITACIFLAQAAEAQPHPAISGKYSNEEIVQAIEKHKASRSYDVAPPAALLQKFHADFPKARDVEWETAGDVYEVEFEIGTFEIGSRDYDAYYDATGNLLMVVEEIRRSELPAIVKNAAENKYPKYHFEDIHKIRRGTETLYKVEMEHSFSDMEVKLLIKADGAFLEDRVDY
jgi:hypothetical protein